MSNAIKKIITSHYPDHINESVDLNQIINICDLYKQKKKKNCSVALSDIEFSSPEFKKPSKKTNNHSKILQSENFIKKHSFFIKIVYVCLKTEIKIFDCNKDVITLKNNHQLIKALENKKKNLINEHQSVLTIQYRNIKEPIDDSYYEFVNNYLSKMRAIDKIIYYLNKLIKDNIFRKTDNLLSLILPYFYNYIEFIEEYNAN